MLLSAMTEATVTGGISLADSFIAQVFPDPPGPADTTNPAGESGTEDQNEITDWLSFDTFYRGWGREGIFPSASVKNYCPRNGTCRIYDWSISEQDTVIRDILPIPQGINADTLIHIWTVANEDECHAVPGAVWNITTSVCETELLVNAVELIRDGSGNDNLLCESGEGCLYTPNLGAYQGHGDLQFMGPGGPAGDILLYRYEINGY